MKRVGYLYESITSVENCRNAILSASRRKTRRKIVQVILKDLDFYAEDLSERLKSLTFVTPYRPRIIRDGLSGKEREIQVPAFYPDQCAHHAIVQVLMPIVIRSSYYWSCANIPKRGNDHASKGIERATIRDVKHSKYCVKCDIRKFYPSIPHDMLKDCLCRKIKDKKALKILYAVIDSYPVGLPIGNYTSPWLAEMYLQRFDMMVKQKLKVKHYVRYADDTVIIGSNKRKMHRALKEVIRETHCLGLEIKKNYQLFLIMRHGRGRKIDFVGKCYGRGYTTIRKCRSLAFMRQSRRIQKLQINACHVPYKMASGFVSRSNCLKRTKSSGLKQKYYDTINIKELKEAIRHESKRKRGAEIARHRSSSSADAVRSSKAPREH